MKKKNQRKSKAKKKSGNTTQAKKALAKEVDHLHDKIEGYQKAIAERDEAQKMLRESEERWRLLSENIPDIIITADPYGTIIAINRTVTGVSVEDTVGQSIYDYIPPDHSGVVREVMKRVLETGEPDKFEILGTGANGPASAWYETRVVPIKHDGEVVAVTQIATDITNRKKAEETLKENLEELKKILDGTVRGLGLMAEKKDPYTAGHQLRVSQLAHAIGKEIGFAKEQLDGVHTAGILHDIGKISVPSEIVTKPGPLSDVEFAVIETHCQVGHAILQTIGFPWPVAEIVFQHHERLDGSGYPLGLSGDAILIEARVLGVSDVVEAMSSYRPYRSPLGIDKALEEIFQHRGDLYDPDVADACLTLFGEKRFEFKVRQK